MYISSKIKVILKSIYQFGEYLFAIHYVSSTVLDPRDTGISKLDEISELHRFFSLVGGDNKKY